MKTFLFLIIFNLVGFSAYAQKSEYNQVLTQESYNLSCNQNSDGSMNCTKINKDQVSSQNQVMTKSPVVSIFAWLIIISFLGTFGYIILSPRYNASH